jgi:hypothetical protein
MDADVPITFVDTKREEQLDGPLRLTAPDSQFNEYLDEKVFWQESPSAIRQSDFWNAGNKWHPNARMPISSQLAIPYHETISEQTFVVGKLIGYLKAKTWQGGQQPSLIRANIQEPKQTTYGSLYEISPQVTMPGPAYTASGFDLTGIDGYPY